MVENSELRTSESNIGHLGFLLLSSCCIGIFFEVVKLDLKITERMVACSCGYFCILGNPGIKVFVFVLKIIKPVDNDTNPQLFLKHSISCVNLVYFGFLFYRTNQYFCKSELHFYSFKL